MPVLSDHIPIRISVLVRIWPFVGPLLLASVGILAAWLFWKTPLLINPYAVLEQLQAGIMPDSTVALLAGLLPIVLLACLVLLLAMVLFLFVTLANERNYMAMIEKLHSTGL